MKRLIALLYVCAAIAVAQDNTKGSIVSLNPAGPPQAITDLNYYDGSGNMIYRCQAVSTQPTFAWYVSGIVPPGTTLTSIVVLTNVGTVTTAENHGLQPKNRVVVSGSTTSALNGTYVIQTVPSSTTFTVTTSGVSDATYATSALKVSTTAPRSTAAIWSIRAYQYSGTNLTNAQWVGATTSMNQICDNRATLYAH